MPQVYSLDGPLSVTPGEDGVAIYSWQATALAFTVLAHRMENRVEGNA